MAGGQGESGGGGLSPSRRPVQAAVSLAEGIFDQVHLHVKCT